MRPPLRDETVDAEAQPLERHPTRDEWDLERFSYVPSLDGLRACAVLGVVGIHGGAHINGGFIGVDIFFVLSGFLITALLLREWTTEGHVRLAAFYARRARRLLPALAFMLLAVALVAAAFPWYYDGAVSFEAAVISVIFYSSNWVSALAGGNHLGPVTPTWSLAIEEQFYLLWPLALLVCLRLRVRARTVLFALITFAALSGIERGLLWAFDVGGDPYYRTDTHADGILVGCALAVASVWKAASLRAFLRSTFTAVVACALLLALALVLTLDSAFLFAGGYGVVALAAAAVVGHVVVARESIVSRVLAIGPLRWLGERSYGLYLYHLPVMMLLTKERLHIPTPPTFLIQMSVALAVTAVSYRFVELPFLKKRRATEPSTPKPPRHGLAAEVVRPLADE